MKPQRLLFFMICDGIKTDWRKPYCMENVMGGIVMELQSNAVVMELKGGRKLFVYE